MTLPRAVAAASVTSSPAGYSAPTIPQSGSLLFHFDAGNGASYPGGSAPNWLDLSVNNRVAPLPSGVTFVGVNGDTPAHFSFGGNSAMTVRNSDNTTVLTGPSPTAYTKMVWFRRDGQGRFDNILSSAELTGQAQHFLYFLNGNDKLTGGHNSDYYRLVADLSVINGSWTFGAVAFSTATGYRLYVNRDDRSWSGSSLVATSAYNGGTDVLSGGLGFQIGGYGNSSYLLGDVATALAYDTALTETEIENYYAETVNRFYGL